MAAGKLHEVCDVGNKGDYGQHDRLDSTLVTEIWAERLGQNLQEMLVPVRAPGFSFMLLGRSFKTIEFLLFTGANRHPIPGRGVSALHQCARAVSLGSTSSALCHKNISSQCAL